MKKASSNPVEKYVTEKTFEKSMQVIAKSFMRVDGRLDKFETGIEKILHEIKAIRDDNKDMRTTISTLDMQVLSHDRKIENILVRVEKLEAGKK